MLSFKLYSDIEGKKHYLALFIERQYHQKVDPSNPEQIICIQNQLHYPTIEGFARYLPFTGTVCDPNRFNNLPLKDEIEWKSTVLELLLLFITVTAALSFYAFVVAKSRDWDIEEGGTDKN
ncbi:hypothetical protein CYQ88_09890 [Hydrogenovibrio sp. SC-1]|nr:hypothetical protein CYQ88_09815 [Hydrogenovibrio sp. SC-1]PLA73692.1 hypothetical protein CYQ88_09890 [Hydrogenovibrio sp. SC-1]